MAGNIVNQKAKEIDAKFDWHLNALAPQEFWDALDDKELEAQLRKSAKKLFLNGFVFGTEQYRKTLEEVLNIEPQTSEGK